MALMKNNRFVTTSEHFGADLPVTPQEQFVTDVYRAVDEATADSVARLQREEGIVPSCKRGCCHCCRYHIVTNIAEAHTLAQYVKREFLAEQIDELRWRTQQWHAWDNSRPGRQRPRCDTGGACGAHVHCRGGRAVGPRAPETDRARGPGLFPHPESPAARSGPPHGLGFRRGIMRL